MSENKFKPLTPKAKKILLGVCALVLVTGVSVTYVIMQNNEQRAKEQYVLNNDANANESKENDGSVNNENKESEVLYKGMSNEERVAKQKENGQKLTIAAAGDDRFDSNKAKEDAKNSKYDGNRDIEWHAQSILREPKHSDYEFDKSQPRIIPNDTEVYPNDIYVKDVEHYSKVKDNAHFRNAEDDVYGKAVERFTEGFNAYQKEYMKPENQIASANYDDGTKKVLITYFDSYENNLRNMKEAISMSKGSLQVDQSTFRMRKTQSYNVYAFEVILNDISDNTQFTYVTGYYNNDANTFKVSATFYLKDGAVFKDKFSLDFSNAIQDVSK